MTGRRQTWERTQWMRQYGDYLDLYGGEPAGVVPAARQATVLVFGEDPGPVERMERA